MLSDCEKCWDTPCTCGWDYKDYPPEALAKHIANITQYRSITERHKIVEYARHLLPDVDAFGNECLNHIIFPYET